MYEYSNEFVECVERMTRALRKFPDIKGEIIMVHVVYCDDKEKVLEKILNGSQPGQRVLICGVGGGHALGKLS